MDNIEGFYGRSRMPSGSRASSYSMFSRSGQSRFSSGYTQRRITTPPAPIKREENRKKDKPEERRYRYYNSPTLGSTGGGGWPFWGWVYTPYYILYPNVAFATINDPTTIDLGIDKKKEEEKKEKKEKFTQIKYIYPEIINSKL